ncbi:MULTISPECIES: hypothetical protein [unclassified Nocardiopsis]
MHADLIARTADLHRAEMERVARDERLLALTREGSRSLWARIRTPRRHTS